MSHALVHASDHTFCGARLVITTRLSTSSFKFQKQISEINWKAWRNFTH